MKYLYALLLLAFLSNCKTVAQPTFNILPVAGIDVTDLPDTLNGKFITELTIWTENNSNYASVTAILTPMQYAIVMDTQADNFTVFTSPNNGEIIKIIMNDHIVTNPKTGRNRQIKGFTIWSKSP